ncbi:unnamed protein product [Protopolystoma xenopodis]|uniref:Uncharacterized protein n=1 Tax=Protopolystoma xenopodis TaxID=117903 RepID=A0A3S4ZSN1_9PLAT|nr:unnamed protein product [Protopolystoma xenopodis]
MPSFAPLTLSHAVNPFAPDQIEAMSSFFELYDKKANQLDEAHVNVRDEIEQCDQDIFELETQLRMLELRFEEQSSK